MSVKKNLKGMIVYAPGQMTIRVYINSSTVQVRITHLGSLLSTQEARLGVALGYRFLRFFRT